VSAGGGRIEVEALRAALAGRGVLLGRALEYHETIDSTNDRARELALAGEPEGMVVLAREQRRGRGREGRPWHSAPELGLYVSVILRPTGAGERAPILALAAAVGAASGLRAASGVDVRIKWPNDLVTHPPGGARRKIGGILTEGRAGVEGVRDVIVGVGVNVNHEQADFPPELRDIAGSLRLERGRRLDPTGVALALLEGLESWYRAWRERGESPVLSAYRGLAVDLEGRTVRVTSPAGTWTGVTAGLSNDGALRVRRSAAAGAGEEIVDVRFGEVERVEEA
jgi:BirA family transcriptional regulator, biotin operon repressor / biotin---[acetyl-CoA-carboxylase] ligase